ncbi:MAG TPA: PH domain-containing protein [Candidatus Luteococcus avicola]|nr:PH domain-containing protein [Candidatus Luteococcus avicola]
MALKRKHLAQDEQIITSMRTHAKVLLGPTFVFLVLAVLLGVGLAMMPSQAQPWGTWALLGAIALALVMGVVVPFWRWRAETYTVTTRRIIHREGIITRSAHDLPLGRINDVSSERGLLDRMLGCGTLRLTTAAEDPVLLHDIPDVERVHVLVTELLFGDPAEALREATD